MTTLPIVVSDTEVTVAGFVTSLDLSVDIGPQGERGSIIFTGIGTPPAAPPDGDPIFDGVTDFKINDLYIDSSTESYWLWQYQDDPGGPIWVQLFKLNPDAGGLAASAVTIADAGGLITATNVEDALQENRTAINLNTTHRTSNGTDHSYINQDVTTTGTPTFASLTTTGNATIGGLVELTSGGPTITVGAGAPISATPPSGSIYLRTDGTGSEEQIYFKEDDSPGTTWTAVGTGGGAGGDVVGPASATDNAIVRFDLTTGKLIQSSGVTINDSNTLNGVAASFTSDLTTEGNLRVDRGGDVATALLRIDSDAAQHAYVQFRTGTTSRWRIGKDSTAEGGSDAGSDFAIYRYNDAGTGQANALLIERATGNATFENNVTVGTAGTSNTLTIVGTDGSGNITYGSGWFNVSGSIRVDSSGGVNINNDGAGAGYDIGATGPVKFERTAANTALITATSGLSISNNLIVGGAVEMGSGGPTITAGSGSPEGSQTADVGSLYLRTDGGTDTSVYRKESGTGNTGWVALAAGGSSGRTIATKTTTYGASASDDIIQATSGTWTLTLPAASGNSGVQLTIKNSGTGVITVDGNASETIDGATTVDLYQYDSIDVVCDGSNWMII